MRLLQHLRSKNINSAKTGVKGKIKVVFTRLLLLLVTFAVGLYFFFPTQALKERIEQQLSAGATAEIDISKLSLLFPPRLQARDINVLAKNAPLKPLHLDALTAKPLWGSLLSNDPGISFTAELYKGNMTGEVYRKGQTEAHLEEIPFSAPLMGKTSLLVTGIVKNGDLSGTFPLKPRKETTLSLEVEDLTLKGMDTLGGQRPELLIGNVTLKATGKGNSFKIESLESSGKDLTASGSGTILVGYPLEKSRLNLLFTLQPAAEFDKNLKELLDLFIKPRGDGSYQLRVSGLLANPRVQ